MWTRQQTYYIHLKCVLLLHSVACYFEKVVGNMHMIWSYAASFYILSNQKGASNVCTHLLVFFPTFESSDHVLVRFCGDGGGLGDFGRRGWSFEHSVVLVWVWLFTASWWNSLCKNDSKLKHNNMFGSTGRVYSHTPWAANNQPTASYVTWLKMGYRTL